MYYRIESFTCFGLHVYWTQTLPLYIRNYSYGFHCLPGGDPCAHVWACVTGVLLTLYSHIKLGAIFLIDMQVLCCMDSTTCSLKNRCLHTDSNCQGSRSMFLRIVCILLMKFILLVHVIGGLHVSALFVCPQQWIGNTLVSCMFHLTLLFAVAIV